MGGLNLFVIVRNNSLNKIDRFGLSGYVPYLPPPVPSDPPPEGDSFVSMFIKFLTFTGSSIFMGYDDEIWGSILSEDEGKRHAKPL
jgi:hypothetical protein